MILLIIFVISAINVILGIISYQKNPKSATHKLLTLLTLIFACWTVANYFSLHSPTESQTLFWIRTVMFITAPMAPVLYLFARAFPRPRLEINTFFLFILLFLSAVVMSISYTPLLFSSVSLSGGVQPTPGPAILLYGILFIGSSLAAFIEIIRKYRKSHGLEKLQLKYMVFAITVSFGLLMFTNFLFVIAFHFSELVILGPIFTLVFVGFISYSIIRHRLLEIRMVIARSVVYTLLLAILATIYAVGVFSLSPYFFGKPIDNQQLLISSIFALFITLTFEPLKDLLENYTDRLFFKGKYNSSEVVLALTTTIASTFKLRELTQKTLHHLLSTLHITHGAFVIFSKQNRHMVTQEGYSKRPRYDKNTIDKLYMLKRKVILDEEKDVEIKQLMRSLDIVVALPLLEHEHNEGLLLLGEKKSGEIYTQQDINVLDIFAPEMSLAIQNASSYEEIKRFNLTLREQVEMATEELQKAHERLQLLDKQKDEFLGMASHELKTPITSIKALAQVLYRDVVKANNTKDAHLLQNIDTQADRLTDLINDLLNLSNIEAGKLTLQKEKFDFDGLVRKTVSDFQYVSSRHKLILEGKVTLMIAGDKNRIEQVLTNLLTNAVKYSPKADQIIVRISDDANQVLVQVQDFGEGIEKKDQQKIFNRFYRTQYRAERNIGGFGLGLYIASEIVKRHGGKIWVESEKGQGSIFNFTIPV